MSRYDRNPNPRGTGSTGFFVGAIVVVLVIVGLFYWGDTDTAGNVAKCSVEERANGVFYFRTHKCEGPGAAAMIAQFLSEHKDRRLVVGPLQEVKGFSLVTERK